MKTVFNDGSPIWLKAISGLLLTYFVIVVFNVGGGMVASAFSDTDTKLAKLKADSCHTIRIRENKCHGGDQEQCEKLKESARWYADKFNSNLTDCFAINSELLIFGVE